MDAFWLIPLAILVLAFVWSFYAFLKSRPLSPGTPHVLVDKPADEEGPEERAASDQDWSGRPCGGYLDWLFGRRR
jgi:hypothetical protein